MRAISTIFRREIGAYLRSPIGWVVASILLLIDGFLFQQVLSKELLSADVLTMFFMYTSIVAGIGGVAVDDRLLEMPIIGGVGQGQRIRQPIGAVDRERLK